MTRGGCSGSRTRRRRGEANATGAGTSPAVPACARGREKNGGATLRVPRPELAEEMGGANLQGGGCSWGQGTGHAWLARHAGGGGGAQRARGGGSIGAGVGDDDAPELREGGGGGGR